MDRAIAFLDTRTPESARALAGCALLGAGFTTLMGIITAEAVYAEDYSTRTNTISDLAGRSVDGAVLQPAAAIFNLAMVVSGALLLLAAYALHRGLGIDRVTRGMALLGAGTVGVGLFPEYYATLHRLSAGTTFISGGITALLVAQVTSRPFSIVSGTLGAVALVALDLVVFGGSTFGRQWLGSGGLERWVAYPITLWQVAFGAYLLGSRGLIAMRHPRGRTG